MKSRSHPPTSSPQVIRFLSGQTSLGRFLLATSEDGVCSILLGASLPSLISELKSLFPEAAIEEENSDAHHDLVAQCGRFIENPSETFSAKLDLKGTPFQQKVWAALKEIPLGTTASYMEIAQRIGQPKAHRAVASACAQNRHAVIIPCHRVLRSDGSLSGYRWGVALKKALLEREALVLHPD